jgi:uncharacterized protein (TIGR00369 family)
VIDFEMARKIFHAGRGPFVALLDLRLESVERGSCVVRMPFRDDLMNGMGSIHGGAVVSLCDSAFYVALASAYGPMQPTATVTLSCSFLASAREGHDLFATAKILKPGKRIVYGEVSVTSNDRIVAHATLNFLNTPLEG